MDSPVAGPAASLLPEAAPRPLRPVRVAIAGLGRMGVAHTAVLSMIPDCEVVGFADPQAVHGRHVRGMGHRAPWFRDLPKMLARTTPDAVFVCTPQDSHAPVVTAALEAGAAVFVEMPLAHDLAAAGTLAAAVERSGRPAACGFSMSFVPVFAAAGRLLAAGVLGEAREARASMYLSLVFGPRRGWMFDPARSGGGVVANVAVQLLFMLREWLGDPTAVSATATRLYGAVEDEMECKMRLPGGIEVGFECSWSIPGYPVPAVVVEVETSNGRLLVSSDALEMELLEARGGFPAGRTRLRDADLPQAARFDILGEGFYLQDAAFLHWVTGGAAPANTAARALGVQRTMHALYASAGSGGGWVDVPR